MNLKRLNLKAIINKLYEKKYIFKKIKYDSSLTKDNGIITKYESIQKQIKIRNPGVDLGRILAMLGIIIHHILLHGHGFKKFRQHSDLAKLNTGVFWHVNTYIFISGYVGYKSTKYSNLLYLWLCTLFYSIGIAKYLSLYKPYIYKGKIKLIDYFPVLTMKYWYFTQYFGMYLFLPIINKGIENINQQQFKIMIITSLGVYIILKDCIIPKKDIFKMNGGYSVIWFLIFYSTGAYFGKFKKDKGLCKKIIYNIIYILIFYYSTYLCFVLPHYPINNRNPKFKDRLIILLKNIFVTRINAFPIILQSITLMLLITNISYNKYIAKFITFIGPLTFGIYLIHDNLIIKRKIMKRLLDNYSSDLPFHKVIEIILITSLKIFAKCAIIDYLRNILFRIFQIRRICMIIEKLIF